MTEQTETNAGFQAYLNDAAGDEIALFPELVVNDEITEINRQGTMIAFIWDNLYPVLGVKDEDDDSKEVRKGKEAQRTRNLARIVGIRQDELPQVFQKGMPDQSRKQRLERAFATISILKRIFGDEEELARNLTFPRPELHGKSPAQALMAGNTDAVLYFAVMSARQQDLV